MREAKCACHSSKEPFFSDGVMSGSNEISRLFVHKKGLLVVDDSYLHALCLYEHYMSCFRECDGRKGVISGSQPSPKNIRGFRLFWLVVDVVMSLFSRRVCFAFHSTRGM
jgi:hypothetical protein